MTKPRHTRISPSILVLLWKMNHMIEQTPAPERVCERQMLPPTQNQKKEDRPGLSCIHKDRLSAACQENSSSFLFSAAILPGGLLRPRQVLIGAYSYGLLLAEGHTAWSPPWDLPVKPYFAGRSFTSSILHVKTSLSFDVNPKSPHCMFLWLSPFPSG